MAAPVMGGAGLGAPSRAEIPLPPGPPGRGRTVGHEREGAAAPRQAGAPRWNERGPAGSWAAPAVRASSRSWAAMVFA